MAIDDNTLYGLRGDQVKDVADKIKENASDIAGLETALDGKQDALTTAQLAAVDSGIDSTKVAEIDTKLDDDTTFWGRTAENGAVSGTIDFGDGATIRTYEAEGQNVNLLLSRTDGTHTSAIDVGSRSINIGTQDTNTISFDTASGGTISAGGAKIMGVGDPTSNSDAANKIYVDTAVASAGASAFTTNEWNALWS